MSEPRVTSKRFIAGATCPACSAADSVKMWNVDEVPHRECVACGYSDTLNEQGNAVPNELDTRVNRIPLKPVNTTVQSIQFFPNAKLKKVDK
ncbi:YheV family putative zinc ribbon protein [Azomonas macrocytogenes]|uniref:Uncharacterized protein n=1 Tax=Azomonas macrocytogenes TaxID=69962 RepID=A0A839T0Q2_AZOMA|nr:YheV family putative zinc ribbon protein [Azomonas macrocytogenes]MBB3102972.1 hypothetical protein [Azomonas macrocytogenes]